MVHISTQNLKPLVRKYLLFIKNKKFPANHIGTLWQKPTAERSTMAHCRQHQELDASVM